MSRKCGTWKSMALALQGPGFRAAGLLERAEAQVGETLDRGGAAADLERIRRMRALAARPPAPTAVAEPT